MRGKQVSASPCLSTPNTRNLLSSERRIRCWGSAGSLTAPTRLIAVGQQLLREERVPPGPARRLSPGLNSPRVPRGPDPAPSAPRLSATRRAHRSAAPPARGCRCPRGFVLPREAPLLPPRPPHLHNGRAAPHRNKGKVGAARGSDPHTKAAARPPRAGASPQPPGPPLTGTPPRDAPPTVGPLSPDRSAQIPPTPPQVDAGGGPLPHAPWGGRGGSPPPRSLYLPPSSHARAVTSVRHPNAAGHAFSPPIGRPPRPAPPRYWPESAPHSGLVPPLASLPIHRRRLRQFRNGAGVAERGAVPGANGAAGAQVDAVCVASAVVEGALAELTSFAQPLGGASEWLTVEGRQS